MIAKALIAQTVGTIVAAVLTYFFGSTLTAELSAAFAYVIGSCTAAAAFIAAFATIVVYALFAIFANICTVGAGRRAAFTYVINASDT